MPSFISFFMGKILRNDFFRANDFYWYNYISKVVPVNFAWHYMRIGVLLLLIFVIGMLFSFPNYEYYKTGIRGKIEKIECRPKNNNFKIGGQWYFVQMPGIQNIEVGDEIVKEPDSWILTVYDSLGNIRYRDSLKTINFNLMEKKSSGD